MPTPIVATATIKVKTKGYRTKVVVHGKPPVYVDGPKGSIDIDLKTGEQQIVTINTEPYNATEE